MLFSKKALVTGSGGLIGSECVKLLSSVGCQVIGLDNDLRQWFFGPRGTTKPVVEELRSTISGYQHFEIDIRDREAVRDLMKLKRPDFIIHAAAQPSHE